MEKLGVSKLQAGILLAVAFANQTKEAFADGFKASDLFGYIDEAMQVQGILASAKEMKAELDDMDMSERQQIMDAVAKELKVDSEKVTGVVLAALDFVAATYHLVNELRTVASYSTSNNG